MGVVTYELGYADGRGAVAAAQGAAGCRHGPEPAHRRQAAARRHLLVTFYRPPGSGPPTVALAVVTSQHDVLLARRRDRTPPWTFPGGAVEPGESPEQAAVRETLEETGLITIARTVIGERRQPSTADTSPTSQPSRSTAWPRRFARSTSSCAPRSTARCAGATSAVTRRRRVPDGPAGGEGAGRLGHGVSALGCITGSSAVSVSRRHRQEGRCRRAEGGRVGGDT
jgi:hypothetical protein